MIRPPLFRNPTAMAHRGEHLSLGPSTLVDIGVHTIILDTVA